MSPDFFAALLKSREILAATLMAEFRDPRAPSEDRKARLIDILGIEGGSQNERLNKGIRTFAEQVRTRVDLPTGIVSVSVTAKDAGLAADIANAMVTSLNQFNLERLQNQSRERRRFSGERLADAEKELRSAEAAHLAFVQQNRHFSASPVLAFENARLERVVQLRQETFVTLAREFEEARIAEVRDTPLLTTIDIATAPDIRTSPHRKRLVLLATLGGLLLGVGLVFAVTTQRFLTSSEAPEVQEFRRTLVETMKDVGSLPVLRRLPPFRERG